MLFRCPLCKKIIKRDMREKQNKGKKWIKSFCEEYGKYSYLKPVNKAKQGEG